MCVDCYHFRGYARGMTCAAFLDGIPEEIIENRFDHRKPHPEDNGIRFEMKEDAPAELINQKLAFLFGS